MTIKKQSSIQRQSLQAYSAGFTLVEILVVVAIIGLLATIVMISLSGVGEKGNNARRIEDLRSVHTALISYYYKSTPYHFLAPNASKLLSGTSGLSPAYIQKIPADPDPIDGDYVYMAKKDNLDDCTGTTACKRFILCANLEPDAGASGKQQIFCCNKDGCIKSFMADNDKKCDDLTITAAADCPK